MEIKFMFNDNCLPPWYRLPAGNALVTPELTFRTTDPYAFP